MAARTKGHELLPNRLFYVLWWNAGARRWYRSPRSFTKRESAERWRDRELGHPEDAQIVASVQRWSNVS